MKYRPRTKPMSHQAEALRRIASAPDDGEAFALLMEMGTGKSKVVLDEFGRDAASGGPQDLLVIAPSGSYRNWWREGGELDVHLAEDFRERLVDVGWRSGGGGRELKTRIEAMLRVRDRPRALFVNIEALSSVERARDLCAEFVSQRLCTVAIDESTRIKNHKAKRTKFILGALGSEAARRRILTGMVAPRAPLDLYAQFEFLNWRILGHKSYYSFRNRYAVMVRKDFGGRKFDMVVGYKNVDELQGLIAPYSYRVLKEDCLDLDPKTYATREVEQTDDQRRMYEELRHWATTAVGESSYVTTTSVITLIMRLQQINCGHVVDEQGQTHDVAERRTAALLEVLEEHDGKAIVWIPWDRTIRKVADVLRKEFGERSVAMYWGGNRGTRAEEEARWKRDPECRFMLASQGAGGIGNNWTEASLVVYYGNTYDLEQRYQSEDRAHRKGQTNRVTYVDLVCPGTVDDRILAALRKKIDMTTMISGEQYREWLI